MPIVHEDSLTFDLVGVNGTLETLLNSSRVPTRSEPLRAMTRGRGIILIHSIRGFGALFVGLNTNVGNSDWDKNTGMHGVFDYSITGIERTLSSEELEARNQALKKAEEERKTKKQSYIIAFYDKVPKEKELEEYKVNVHPLVENGNEFQALLNISEYEEMEKGLKKYKPVIEKD